MPRAGNGFYHDNSALGASIGQSLGRALFGDPELAQQLALRRAQMDNYAANADESRAHAGLYGEQTRGLTTQNDASAGLPEMFKRMFAPPAPAASTAPVSPGAAAPAAPSVDDQIRAGLPALFAAMGQMEGDKIDPNKMVGGLSAMFGSDELARRGLVAQGQTPGKDFAITPDRADAIRDDEQAADFNKGTAVARVNHATDIPIANIRASTERRGQDIRSSDTRRGQDLTHVDRQTGLSNKFVPMGPEMVTSVIPGARITSGERSVEHNADVGGAEHSYHLPGDGVETYDIEPTGNFEAAKAAMKAKYGDRLVEAKDETHRPGHGPHYHFAVAQERAPTGKASGSSKAPKAISAATQKMLDGELEKQLASRGIAGQPDPGTMASMRGRIAHVFQSSGNAVDAVSETLDRLQRAVAAKAQRGKPAAKAASAPPVAGARKAPDGQWYVQRGGKFFRVEA